MAIKVPIDLFSDGDGILLAGANLATLLASTKVATNYGALAAAAGAWTAQGDGHYVYTASAGEETAATTNLLVAVATSAGNWRENGGRWAPAITLGTDAISAAAVSAGAAQKIAQAVLDRPIGARTVSDILRILLAIEAGKSDGQTPTSGTEHFYDPDTNELIGTYTFTPDGRTSVTISI